MVASNPAATAAAKSAGEAGTPDSTHPQRRWRLPGQRKLRTGEVLVQAGLLTSAQLARALAQQVAGGPPLGQWVVALGLATETDVLAALNAHHRIHAVSLSDNIPGLVTSRAIARRSLSRLRLGLRLRLSLVLTATIWFTTFALSLVLIGRHQAQLTDDAVRMGALSLAYLADQAEQALSRGDGQSLSRGVRSVSAAADVLAVAVTDAEGIVRAHSDAGAIGKPLVDPTAEGARRDGLLRYLTVKAGDGAARLYLSRPITGDHRKLGRVHATLTLDRIATRVHQETVLVLAIGGLILLIGIALAVRQGGSLMAPFTAMLAGVRAGDSGRTFRVRLRPRHEFEDLAGAFEGITHELNQKLLMERSLGRYVNASVVEHIRSRPEETWLKGTRRDATVLFTDVRGFTAIAEELEPEALVDALNAYFAIAARAVVLEGGHVDKYIGDGLMAVFGVPTPHDDHALRAVKAAMEMQKTLRRQARLTRNPFLAQIGIGVNSGELLAGNIGSAERMEYTVIGDCVNMASRLTTLANPGEVIVSDSVIAAIPRYLATVRTLEGQTIKGKRALVVAHKVLKIDF